MQSVLYKSASRPLASRISSFQSYLLKTNRFLCQGINPKDFCYNFFSGPENSAFPTEQPLNTALKAYVVSRARIRACQCLDFSCNLSYRRADGWRNYKLLLKNTKCLPNLRSANHRITKFPSCPCDI